MTDHGMKALQYAEYGEPSVLRVVDVNEPHAGPGQIRVAVKAVGINPVDWKLRKGVYKARLPAITGSDIAGVVDEIGDGVTDVTVGDERHRLQAGDCLANVLDRPLMYHNPTRGAARYPVVLCSEAFSLPPCSD